MTALLFACTSCVSCSPCPTPIKINGWKYNRMACSGATYEAVETLVAFGVALTAGAYPAIGITNVKVYLALVSAPTVVVGSAITPTIGSKQFRPTSGTGCDYTAGTTYVTYDPRTHLIHHLDVTETYPATGSITYYVTMDDGPGYGCEPCTTQAGLTAHKIGATAGNTVNLSPAMVGAIGDDCDPGGGGGAARIKSVAEWITDGDPCCAAWSGSSRDINLAGCSQATEAQTVSTFKSVDNISYAFCSSNESKKNRTCITLSTTTSLIVGPTSWGAYSASTTISLSTVDGSVSASIDITKTACGAPVLTGAVAITAYAAPDLSYAPDTSTDTAIAFLDVGDPCYKYRITLTISGSTGRSTGAYGCGLCDGSGVGCSENAFYRQTSRNMSINTLFLEVVAK